MNRLINEHPSSVREMLLHQYTSFEKDGLFYLPINQELSSTQAHTSGAVPYIDRKLTMLEGTARMLSSNYDVTITFSKEGKCRTNFEEMILPYHEAVDEALIMSLMGHEVGHLAFTDFTLGRTISRKRDIRNRELLFHIYNTLEDVRIEYLIEEKYPGFKNMFKRLIPYVKERKKEVINEMSDLQKVLDVLYLLLRGDDPTDIYSKDIVTFTYCFLVPTAEKVIGCDTTKEMLPITIEIYHILSREKGQQVSDDLKEQNLKKQQEKCSTCKSKDCTNCSSVPEHLKPQSGSPSNGQCNKKGNDLTDKSKCPQCGKPMPGSNSEEPKDDSQQNQKVSTGTKCGHCGQENVKIFHVGQPVKHFRTNRKGKIVAIEDNKVQVEWQ